MRRLVGRLLRWFLDAAPRRGAPILITQRLLTRQEVARLEMTMPADHRRGAGKA